MRNNWGLRGAHSTLGSPGPVCTLSHCPFPPALFACQFSVYKAEERPCSSRKLNRLSGNRTSRDLCEKEGIPLGGDSHCMSLIMPHWLAVIFEDFCLKSFSQLNVCNTHPCWFIRSILLNQVCKVLQWLLRPSAASPISTSAEFPHCP